MSEKKYTGKKRETSWPERTSYKGHTIVITAARTPDDAAKARSATEGQALQIAIDGQPLEVLQIEPRRFESIRMPYRSYESPLDIARDVIDFDPAFRSR